jgi:hypothetical protein
VKELIQDTTDEDEDSCFIGISKGGSTEGPGITFDLY